MWSSLWHNWQALGLGAQNSGPGRCPATGRLTNLCSAPPRATIQHSTFNPQCLVTLQPTNRAEKNRQNRIYICTFASCQSAELRVTSYDLLDEWEVKGGHRDIVRIVSSMYVSSKYGWLDGWLVGWLYGWRVVCDSLGFDLTKTRKKRRKKVGEREERSQRRLVGRRMLGHQWLNVPFVTKSCDKSASGHV